MGQSATGAASVNAGQIEHWNADAGDAWARLQARMDAQIGPLGEEALEALGPRPGERIIDVGCGCGDTSLALATRVSPGGSVTGIDISRPMLAVARRRAAATGARVEFLEADAETHAFPAGEADAIFSRFGVMFFERPARAFANLRSALKTGGRLAFLCWQGPEKNPFITAPMMAARPLLAPEPPPDPHAPGPFAFADGERVAGILREAGFANIHVEPRERTLAAGSLDQVMEVALNIGPLGRALREQPDRREPVVQAVRDAMSARAGADGIIHLPTATWVVTAANRS